MLKAVVEGKIIRDPLTYIRQGQCTLKLLIAHIEESKSGSREIWVDVTFQTDDNSLVNQLSKGVIVHAEGQPQAKLFTSKTTGELIASLMLRANSIQVLGEGNHKPVNALKNDSF